MSAGQLVGEPTDPLLRADSLASASEQYGRNLHMLMATNYRVDIVDENRAAAVPVEATRICSKDDD